MSAFRRPGGVLLTAGFCLSLLVAGCSQVGAPPASGLVRSTAVPERDYRLSAGDKLKITVFGEEQLTGENEVGAAGSVTMPLIGEVPARGMTVGEFTDSLRMRLSSGYIMNPKISVQIVNYRPFYLHGEVLHGGEFAYRPGLRLEDAVAMAGGYSYRANTTYIYLRREGASAEEAVSLDSSFTVLPGDNIRIPERLF